MPKKTIFLTGATGFIGEELIRTLITNRYYTENYKILCLIRETSNSSYIKAISKLSLMFDFVVGDLKDYESFEKYLENADIIIHCAANLGYDNRKNLYKDNVIGTTNLIKAAEKYKIKQFINISTISAARKHLGHYGKSKLLADKELIKSKLNYTILRPAMVIGKKSHGFQKFVKYIKKLPVIPLTGSGNNRIQIVHVKDVVDGIVNAIENEKTDSKIYYLCNKRPIRYKDYIREISKALKLSKLIIPIPPKIIFILGNIYKLIFNKSVITKDGVLGLTLDYSFDISDSEKDLKFRPMGNKKAIMNGLGIGS
ncbi:MAG: NAD-dependent epimerase/dehydratase family protein [Candidatus Woesearchaeota archaeon]